MLKEKKRLIIRLIVIFLVNMILIFVVQISGRAEAAGYKKGSSGGTVGQIQKVLSDEGFYADAVDGVYGSATEAAVKSYQQAKGMTGDGVAGDTTLEAMGITGAAGVPDNETDLLARIISAEARGEPYSGQVAVGAVILNRVNHPSFPDSVSGVIYQPGAFSALDDGQFEKPVAESAYQAAREALGGWDPTGGATFYYNPAGTSSEFMWSRPVMVTIGNHRFCS